MEKTQVQTFVLSQNENGQKIYTNTDRTKRFILDDGDIIPYNPVSEPIKTENEQIMSEDEEFGGYLSSISSPVSVTIGTPSPDVMGTLESATEMDNHLMQELDSDLVDADGGPFIPQYMNIQAPLHKLRSLLEQRLHVNLSDYEIYLQGMQKLEDDKTLVEQCIEGQGMVQVNVQIQANLKRINILDVLKPGEDYIEENEPTNSAPPSPEPQQQKAVQWQVDSNYRKEQDRLKIPHDPEEWSQLHVKHWIQWAVRQFNLSHVKLSDWAMTGKQLQELNVSDFHKIVPQDPGNVFWTHLELLRQMKVVAVRREDGDEPQTQATPETTSSTPETKMTKLTGKVHRILPNYVTANTYFDSQGILSCRSNNGQIQLWQFLLELLTNIRYKTVISWTGNEGEFKLKNPQVVAQLWGERKNKPAMNYEKLSRALRYYYDGDMIAKVHGERFVYKFVCNLKELLGYDARELSNLVNFGNPMVTFSI